MLYRFESLHTFSACKALTQEGARDGRLPDLKEIIMKLHVNWGRPSAQQLKRETEHLDPDNMHVAKSVGAAAAHCDVCRAFKKATHVPTAGKSTVSTLKGKFQEYPLFLGKPISLRAMDVSSKHSLLIPARPKRPQGVSAAFCSAWSGV